MSPMGLDSKNRTKVRQNIVYRHCTILSSKTSKISEISWSEALLYIFCAELSHSPYFLFPTCLESIVLSDHVYARSMRLILL